VEPFHLLIKPTGADCNLWCRYCFFRPKASLYPGSGFRMTDAVMEAAVEQLLAAHPGPEVGFGWQGGEPTLMGLAFFERVMAAVERHRRPGQRVAQSIQTNGVLVDDEWAAFFARHRFLVGLSLDGPPAMHDAYRVNAGGQGTHHHAVRAWDRLGRHGVEVNVLCTVHAANAGQPLAVYRYFRDVLAARFVQFIPIVELVHGNGPGEKADGAVTARSVRPGEYGRFLSAIFDEWVRRDVGTVFVQAFDAALSNWVGQPSLCVFAPACGRAPVLEHNGDLYACDHFVDPDHRLGNILQARLETLLEAEALREFGEDKRRLPERCADCDVLFACRGECPRNRFAAEAGGEPGVNYLCEDYRHFFRHVSRPMEVMAGLLRGGRAPAEIMAQLAADPVDLPVRLAAAGRNDPCPCGSGLKVKKCHGGR
jgi:uncharacterized protein